MKVKESKGRSLHVGKLPRGCKLCINGMKTVIFLGGKCSRPDHCSWYCPISMERRINGSRHVNERVVTRDDDILDEIKATGAKGASFTGGEPIGYFFEDVLHYTMILKENYSSKFHLHLYTTGLEATREKLRELGKAGLDEIRFHPPDDHLTIIIDALDYITKVGVEIPIIPSDEYFMRVINIIKNLEKMNAHFLNLNEFEFSETNSESLKKAGFKLKKDTIAAVEGSEFQALRVLSWFLENGKNKISVHYCPIVTKDEFQLKNRYKRRAKNTRKSHEVITSDGTILYGRISFKNTLNLKSFLEKLINNKTFSKSKLEIQEDKLEIYFHPRMLKNRWFRGLILKEDAGIVEALPTNERNECEFTPIKNLEGNFDGNRK
ncbi:MAG: radical SAM protein [Promethearchaeota archaeon]